MVENDKKILGDVMDLKELQGYQDVFSEAQRLYLICFDSSGKNITKLSGRAKEKKLLEDLFGKKEIIEMLKETAMQAKTSNEVIWNDTQYKNILTFGISCKINDKHIGIWSGLIVLNKAEFDENNENLYETTKLHNVITKTSAQRGINILTLLSSKFICAYNDYNKTSKKLEEIQANENNIKEELKRKETINMILEILDKDEEFEILVAKILEIISKYLKISIASVAKLHEETNDVEVISSFHCGKEEYDKRIEKELLVELFTMNNEESMIIIEPDIKDIELKCKMEKYHIKSIISIPMYLGKGPVIYATFVELGYNRYWDSKTVRFLFDVCKMIQNMMFRRISKNSLISSYSALKEILNNLGSGIFVIDKSDRKILFCNDIIEKTAGEDMVGKYCYDYHHKGFVETCRYCLPLKHKNYFIETYDNDKKKWFEISYNDITWVDGREVSLCVATDVTQKKSYQQKIEFQANNDFLTGLFNRMRCEEDLEQCVKDSISMRTQGQLLFIDLDDFKHINDGLGHQYGDTLLKMISIALQQISGIEKRCYRVGGDEFVIIIEPAFINEKDRILSEIQGLFAKPWYLGNAEYYCTMSMGIVSFPENGTDVNDLIKKADIAMYDAKKSGKNRYVFYNKGEDQFSYKKLDMEKNMRSAVAIGCKEFEVYIQPIVDVKSQKCIGGESLVRWNSLKLGFMGPCDFIPLAEKLGLISPIGEYVLKKSCLLNKKWSDKGINVRINVNLSIIQLLANNVVDVIKSIIEETKVNPNNLVLEVTESLAINDMTRMKRIISEIKQLGVTIALDDFGTGYSSLNYIKQMDLDIIKVDRTFIKDLDEDEYAKAFIKLIAELSQKLEVQVCVEGVEQKTQLDILRELNISMIQGYYFGKPMKIEEFEKKFLKIQG